MANVSGQYANLLGGVSRQPESVRADGQAEEMLNCMARPVDGLTDREPFQIKGILADFIEGQKLHHWDAGDGNQYIAAIGNGAVKVWDWWGNPLSVTLDATAAPYIAANGNSLNVANVGDYLMVANNTVVPAAGSAVGALAATPTFWIKNVKWGQRIAVWANITVGSATHRFEFAYTSPDGTVTTTTEGSDTSKANTKFIDPSYVVWRWQYILQNGGNPADFTGPAQWADVKHSLATVTIDAPAGISPQHTFTFDGATFYGPTGMPGDHAVSAVGTDNPETDVVTVFRTVSDVAQLPPRSYDGHVVEVSQDDTGDFSFYMRFAAESTSTPPGGVPLDEWECMLYPDFGEYDIGFGGNTASGSMTNTTGTPVGTITAFYIYHDGQKTLNLGCGATTPTVQVRCAGQLVTMTQTGTGWYEAYNQEAIFNAMANAHSTGQPLGVYFRPPTMMTADEPEQQATVVTGVPSGKWVETHRPGLVTALNPATMPHALVRITPTTFHFAQLNGQQLPGIAHTESWTARTVGDDDSNPLPDFIGQPINGMGVYKDRMYIFAGESMRFSKVGLYWDLFIESAVEGGDDDGFDVTSVTGKVQTIRNCVPHQQSLIVFAEHGQFVLDGSSVLTPSSAALLATTSFLLDHDVEPVANGDVVYFADRALNGTGIREFYLDSITATNNARPITQHIGNYIPANMGQLIASAEDSFLAVIPQRDYADGAMYIYQYTMDNGNRLQSAWHQWQLGGYLIPIYGWIQRGLLYMVVKDVENDVVNVCFMDLNSSVVPGDPFGFIPRLDWISGQTGVGNTVTLGPQYPGSRYKDTHIFMVGNGNSRNAILNVSSWSEDGVVHFFDDVTDTWVNYGRQWVTQYKPTRPYPKDSMGRRIMDRFIINQFGFNVADTGPFTVTLQSEYYDDVNIPVDGLLASPDTVLGEKHTASGRVPVMVSMDPNHTTMLIQKANPYPLNLTSLEYRGRYTQRATRI